MGFSRKKGFEIAVDAKHHVLRCRLWGAWDLDLAQKYKYALMEKIAELHISGDAWYALADFTAFYPLSGDVQSLIRDYLLDAETRGMKQLVSVGDMQEIRHRLDRIFCEYDHQGCVFVDSDEQAMQWILQEKPK